MPPMNRRRSWGAALLILFLLLGASAVAAPSFVNRVLGGAVRIPEVPFRLGLDLQGGMHLVYQADLSPVSPNEYDAKMRALRDDIERRVNSIGVQEPVVQVQGNGENQRLIVELAGIEDPDQAIRLIGQTPFLEFREPKENYGEIIERNQKHAEEGAFEKIIDPYRPTDLTGEFLARADMGRDSSGLRPTITLRFDEEGSRLFEEMTERNIGRPIAIFLNRQLLQAPVVQEKIAGGTAQITGQFTIEEARKIARDLNHGALPVAIELLSQQRVGATLGAQSLQESLRAGAVGLAALVLFMALVYRIPGLLASLALVIYVAVLLSIFKLVPVTMSLAGIAGVILSLGMAVDANILIFSRMKEEMREGAKLPAAVEEGFRRAWPSIRDGNLTTLLVSFILFFFGSSFVQGFALALSLGILLSMFSAIAVTRTFLRICAGTVLDRWRWLWG